MGSFSPRHPFDEHSLDYLVKVRSDGLSKGRSDDDSDDEESNEESNEDE